MDQTEILLSRARTDADRELIAAGHDPSVVEWFLTLTPAQRLVKMEALARFILRRRWELGIE